MQTAQEIDFSPVRRLCLWEGTDLPPLRMLDYTDEEYVPEGFVPTSSATAAEAPQAAQRTKGPRTPFLHQLSLLLVFGVLCLGAYYMISRYVVTPVVIQGRSMTPTLRDGETYFLNRWIYLFKAPAHGDLVVIKDPGHDDFAVKRIIASPGDWLNLKDGKVYLNGVRLNESYLPRGTFTDTGDTQEKWIQLGSDQFFVMGDNRSCSEDSRAYGNIHRANILGAIRN